MRSRTVKVVGIYPESRSEPKTLKCKVIDGAAHTTVGGTKVVLPLDGRKAHAGPTFLANLDKGVIMDVSPSGDVLEIDGFMNAIWADNMSSHRINQFDEGLAGLLRSAMPWFGLVTMLIVIMMGINMWKNGGGL